MYATKFRELGHTIDAAQTAENAITKLEEGEYDVILLDMVMPGMSGVDLLAEIKKRKLGGSPKCIMLSNQSEESDKTSALREGAIGYIVKAELIPSEVVEQVLKLIEKE